MLTHRSVAWQANDLSLFKPASAPAIFLTHVSSSASSSSTTPTSRKTAAAATRTNTNAKSDTPKPESSHHNSSLSTGAAAGIGVGATAGAIGILACLWLILRRYKFTRREPAYYPAEIQPEKYEPTYYSPSAQEIDAAEAYYIGRPFEADSRTRSPELEGDTRLLGTSTSKRSMK